MKDELNEKIIEEFVVLRAKMYSLKTKKEEMKKAKEVKENIVKRDISHQDYTDCLFEERKFMHTMQTIRSFKHQHYTIKENKVSLSPYNNKQYLLDDGLTLCHTDILVCCKYLGNFLIIFLETFVIYVTF